MAGPRVFLQGPRSALERARPYLFTLFLPIVILAVGSLVMEYGFRIQPYDVEVLHRIEVVALVGLLSDPLLRVALARDRRAMVRFRWFQLSIAVAFLLFLAAVFLWHVNNAGGWALRAVQATMVLSLLARLVELQQFLAALRVRPALLLVGSFAALIAIGTGLLLLPAATAEGETTGFTDALFTATSAVCVTGLTVVDTGGHWTLFGQLVAISLIQLGGIGLMTFTSVMALLMWRGLRVRETMVIREAFTSDLRAEVRRVTAFILVSAVAIEAAGAALMLGTWSTTSTGGPITLADRAYYSVFHSISAFCNAGFGLYSRNLMDFRSTWGANLVIPLLIISGGIGFSVLYNLARLVRYRLLRRPEAPMVKKRLSLHSKLALVTTAGLLAAGMAAVIVLEAFPGRHEVWHSTAYMPVRTASGEEAPPPEAAPAGESPLGASWGDRVLGAWFLAVTARTAGFNTIDMTHVAFPTKFITIVLMFIGASPGSTGGGIKTVTFAVVLCGVWAALRGYPRTGAFRRVVPNATVLRAMAILVVCVAWVAGISTAIGSWGMRPEGQFTFLDVLFETTSAFGTVGLSAGATPLLNELGRMLISMTMFIGRVGPITLFVAMQGKTEVRRYTYAAEDVAIG